MRMGVVSALPDQASPCYYVQFPNGDFEEVEPLDLCVRVFKDVDDPLDLLVAHAHETPFFHDHRWAFVRSLIEQRAASRGLTGLLSSAIVLQPHQVDVARRVLEDAVPRYLLADEVGLGKTIEAGIVLRQYLIDNPAARVIVAVPHPLVDQWKRELVDKFGIDDFPDGAVRVTKHEALATVPTGARADFLVLDEAHHVAEKAFATGPERGIYQAATRLAQAASHLILLSATPVRRNERNFLALLHLLDPDVYSLDDFEAFRLRVDKRQEIGRALVGFTEDIANVPFLIEDSLDAFERHFPQDERLKELCAGLRSVALTGSDDEVPDETTVVESQRLIRAIRVHLSETYRLHQRMLRYRREGRAGDLVRGRRFNGVAFVDLDPRRHAVSQHLELWRQMTALAIEDSGLDEDAYGRIAQEFFEAAGGDLAVLEDRVRARLTEKSVEQSATPLFEGERERLEVLLSELERPTEADRVGQFLEWVHENNRPSTLNPPQKIVVFTSYTSVAREIAARLGDVYMDRTYAVHTTDMLPTEQDEAVGRFREDEACCLLVCDRSAEEGRNFQFADAVFHFDLPWDPNRVEQRLGRVDRYGKGNAVPSIVVDAQASIPSLWLRVLADGYQVFDRSISALQHLVEDDMRNVRRVLLFEGAEGLTSHIADLKQRVDEEFHQVLLQDQLDSIQIGEARKIEEPVEAIYDCEAESDIAGATDRWFTRLLQFDAAGSRGENGRDRIVTYEADPRQTLVPWRQLSDLFVPHLNRPSTYSRMAAVRNPGTKLLRLGNPLVDAMHRYVRCDDRGQAYALWRNDPDWPEHETLVALRFNFVVEADLEYTADATEVELRALRRRADEFLPPFVHTVWVDDRLQWITDTRLIARLEAPYEKGRDTNLSYERLGALHALVPAHAWEGFCRDAATLAFDSMAQAADLDSVVAAAIERTKRVTERRLGTLVLRMKSKALVSQRQLDLEREEALSEVLLAGVRSPAVRLDSLGCVVLASSDPFQHALDQR